MPRQCDGLPASLRWHHQCYWAYITNRMWILKDRNICLVTWRFWYTDLPGPSTSLLFSFETERLPWAHSMIYTLERMVESPTGYVIILPKSKSSRELYPPKKPKISLPWRFWHPYQRSHYHFQCHISLAVAIFIIIPGKYRNENRDHGLKFQWILRISSTYQSTGSIPNRSLARRMHGKKDFLQFCPRPSTTSTY